MRRKSAATAAAATAAWSIAALVGGGLSPARADRVQFECDSPDCYFMIFPSKTAIKEVDAFVLHRGARVTYHYPFGYWYCVSAVGWPSLAGCRKEPIIYSP